MKLCDHSTTHLSYILMNSVTAQLIETNSVGEWFRTRLHGERDTNISLAEPLTIHGADADSPVVGIVTGQLRNVRGHITFSNILTIIVNVADKVTEVIKLGNYKLILESL